MTGRTHSIDEKIADLTERLRARFALDRVLLFGSTAKRSRLQESDIDLIIVSKGFEGMSIPERQGAVQKEWDHPEELQALTYTPAEFSQVSKRLTMREILAYAVEVPQLRRSRIYPRCRKKSPHSSLA